MIKIFIFIIAITSSIYATEIFDPNKIKEEILASCNKGNHVLLLFLSESEMSSQSEEDDNELYADWSYYLNQGLSSFSDKLTVIETSVKSGRTLFKSKQIPSDSYSIVFFPCGKKGLYAKSAILEPYVYNYIRLYTNNKEKNLMLSELLGTKDIKDDKLVTPKSIGLEFITLGK